MDTLPPDRHFHHSWVWHKTPRFWTSEFWKPARTCLRCKAKLRLEPIGPRGGKRKTYKGPGDQEYRVVADIPPCNPIR